VAPPRQVWINPNRRTSVIIAAIVAAVVLLAVGAIGGAAISNHDRHGRFMTVVPQNRYGHGGPQYGDPRPNFPKRPTLPLPGGSATPAPTTTS
jgi:hypothetical protein